MVEEKLSKKISVLMSKSDFIKFNQICKKIDRPVSNCIRLITLEWMNRMLKG